MQGRGIAIHLVLGGVDTDNFAFMQLLRVLRGEHVWLAKHPFGKLLFLSIIEGALLTLVRL